MHHLRTLRTAGALVTLLAVALGGGPARAASTVDVTYDLSDSTLVWDFGSDSRFPVDNDDFSINGSIAGSMKVRYASDSSSGMPISHDAATLLTFNLTASSLALQSFTKFGGGPFNYRTWLSGTLHWQLTSPAAGNLTSNGALTGITANLLMTGTARCAFADTAPTYCQQFVGLPAFTVYPNYSHSGSIGFAGSAGPYGGAQSTRHTLSGRASAIYWAPGAAAIGLGSDFITGNDYGGAFLVGREIVREAEGHETRVIPEPGTLLLLGSGAAGLGLVRRATRRRRG